MYYCNIHVIIISGPIRYKETADTQKDTAITVHCVLNECRLKQIYIGLDKGRINQDFFY